MERLTQSKDYPAAGPEEILAKLAAYEETGLTPEQIREIDKLYSKQAKELHKLKTLISANNLPDGVEKAILVLDMPETCEDCPLQLDMIDAEFGEIIYNANICRGCGKRNFNSKEKPAWCPLKPVSEMRLAEHLKPGGGKITGIRKEDLDDKYKEGFAAGTIIQLKLLREKLLERRFDLEDEFKMCGHSAICNRISELNDIIDIIEKRVFELSPNDCDW